MKELYVPHHFMAQPIYASLICKSNGFELASMDTSQEYEKLKEILKQNSRFMPDYVVIDGSNLNNDDWSWINSKNKINYDFLWSNKQPYHESNKKFCLTLGPKFVYQLNHHSCIGSSKKFICQKLTETKKKKMRKNKNKHSPLASGAAGSFCKYQAKVAEGACNEYNPSYVYFSSCSAQENTKKHCDSMGGAGGNSFPDIKYTEEELKSKVSDELIVKYCMDAQKSNEFCENKEDDDDEFCSYMYIICVNCYKMLEKPFENPEECEDCSKKSENLEMDEFNFLYNEYLFDNGVIDHIYKNKTKSLKHSDLVDHWFTGKKITEFEKKTINNIINELVGLVLNRFPFSVKLVLKILCCIHAALTYACKAFKELKDKNFVTMCKIMKFFDRFCLIVAEHVSIFGKLFNYVEQASGINEMSVNNDQFCINLNTTCKNCTIFVEKNEERCVLANYLIDFCTDFFNKSKIEVEEPSNENFPLVVNCPEALNLPEELVIKKKGIEFRCKAFCQIIFDFTKNYYCANFNYQHSKFIICMVLKELLLDCVKFKMYKLPDDDDDDDDWVIGGYRSYQRKHVPLPTQAPTTTPRTTYPPPKDLSFCAQVYSSSYENCISSEIHNNPLKCSVLKKLHNFCKKLNERYQQTSDAKIYMLPHSNQKAKFNEKIKGYIKIYEDFYQKSSGDNEICNNIDMSFKYYNDRRNEDAEYEQLKFICWFAKKYMERNHDCNTFSTCCLLRPGILQLIKICSKFVKHEDYVQLNPLSTKYIVHNEYCKDLKYDLNYCDKFTTLNCKINYGNCTKEFFNNMIFNKVIN